MEDSYKHRGLRRRLVIKLEEKGIKNQHVLDAINKIPRHYFIDSIFDSHAYEDKAFPIAAGQTISQPYTVAFQTELLEIHRGKKILEIGTGSGYQAAILCELGAKVYSIEFQQELFRRVIRLLPAIGYHPHLYRGDGSLGLPSFAPYDGIIVTAGAPTIPTSLIKQLRTGGIMVIPVGDFKTQKMCLIRKISETKIIRKTLENFSFVPLRGKNGWT